MFDFSEVKELRSRISRSNGKRINKTENKS